MLLSGRPRQNGGEGGARTLDASHEALLELQLHKQFAVLDQRMARRVHLGLFDAVASAYYIIGTASVLRILIVSTTERLYCTFAMTNDEIPVV